MVFPGEGGGASDEAASEGFFAPEEAPEFEDADASRDAAYSFASATVGGASSPA